MNFKSFITITLYFFLSVVTKAENISLKLNDNKLSLNTSEISINNAGFSVSILENEKPVVLIPAGNPEIEKSDRKTHAGEGTETRYTWKNVNGYEIAWVITQIEKSIVAIRAELINRTSKTIFLQNFKLLDTPEDHFLVKGKAGGWMLASTDVESRRWGTLDKDIPTEIELTKEQAYSRSYFSRRGINDKANDRKWRCYYNDFSLYRNPGISGISVAAVDTIADVYFELKVNDVKMKLEIIADMSEVEVSPGESRTSDEVLIISQPWGIAQQIRSQWLAEITGAKITKKPAYGWCSWYRTGTKVTSDDIMNISDFAKINRNKVPFEVIQIDEGWQVKRGEWTEINKFTCGLETVSDSIRKSGAMAGIWLSPVCPENTERQFSEDCYVNFKIGNPSVYRLDPTHPVARKFMFDALKYSYNKGYRYFKLDFAQLEFGARRFYNSKFTRMQAQRALFRLYREAIGNDSYLLACGIMDQRSMVPFVDADRIGTDCNPTQGFARKLASDSLPGNIWGLWFPTLSMANKCYENGILCNGDPDVTYTGNTGLCRPLQLITFHSFVGIYGGLALTSDNFYLKDFGNDDNLRMMEILYPISAEKGHNYAGGWDMYGKEFGYEVKRDYGTFTNVVIWNPNHSKPQDLSIKNVPTENLGKKFHAWSFWDEKYIGIIDKNYIAKGIPFYEHQLLRLTPLKDQPILIGSNLHISMGSTEVKGIDYSNSHINIELDPNAGCRKGRLYFYSEKPLGNARSTNSDCSIIRQSTNIYIVVLTNRIRDKKELVTIDISGQYPALEQNQLTDSNLNKFNLSTFTPSWLVSW
jgi:alpha-galactosidase